MKKKLILWKINKIDKPIVNMTEQRREKMQISKISDEKGT
jgi:hypothetical protein